LYFWGVVMDTGQTSTKRIAAGGVVITAVLAVIIRNFFWMSGWLGLCAGLATATLIRSRKAFAVMVLVVALVMAMFGPAMYKRLYAKASTVGDFDRFSLMAGSWKYATTFPLGVGPGNYRSYNSFYYGRKWGTTSYTSAHGTYSQHLSEMGIPGAILFLSILVSGFLWMLRSYRRLPRGPSKLFLLAAMGQLVGISVSAIIGDYIIPTYHNGGLLNFSTTVYSWLIWGLAIAHVRISGIEEHGLVNIDS
jgi:O-antigen ligase